MENEVPNINFKGFVVDRVQANWILARNIMIKVIQVCQWWIASAFVVNFGKGYTYACEGIFAVSTQASMQGLQRLKNG